MRTQTRQETDEQHPDRRQQPVQRNHAQHPAPEKHTRRSTLAQQAIRRNGDHKPADHEKQIHPNRSWNALQTCRDHRMLASQQIQRVPVHHHQSRHRPEPLDSGKRAVFRP